ncbi:hypothetical protein ACFX2A_045413 [Malus domestica]
MEFWGVEVKAGEPLKVVPEESYVIHLSQATLGELKKGGDQCVIHVKVGDQKLVLANLSSDKMPQIPFDLVFDKEFELSHNLKSGSVHFYGYQTYIANESDEDQSDFDSESEEDLPLNFTRNGNIVEAKPAPPKTNAVKPESSGKQKVKIEEPIKDEDDSDDSDEDDSDDDDESSDEDMLGADNTDEDGEDNEEVEDTPTPKNDSKKRPNESAPKNSWRKDSTNTQIQVRRAHRPQARIQAQLPKSLSQPISPQPTVLLRSSPFPLSDASPNDGRSDRALVAGFDVLVDAVFVKSAMDQKPMTAPSRVVPGTTERVGSPASARVGLEATSGAKVVPAQVGRLVAAVTGQACCAVASEFFACNPKDAVTKDLTFYRVTLPVQDRVRDLLGRLTLEEKVKLLVKTALHVPRLGIKGYEWWSEALHGVSNMGPGTKFGRDFPSATSFPQVITTAASFNASLWEAIGRVVSDEARAMYKDGDGATKGSVSFTAAATLLDDEEDTTLGVGYCLPLPWLLPKAPLLAQRCSSSSLHYL